MEAAACGIPIIASKIGGLIETVADGKSGFLVPPENPRAIADKLSQLIEDRSQIKALGKFGRKFILQNYTWEKNASEMEKIYMNCIS